MITENAGHEIYFSWEKSVQDMKMIEEKAYLAITSSRLWWLVELLNSIYDCSWSIVEILNMWDHSGRISIFQSSWWPLHESSRISIPIVLTEILLIWFIV